jgi:hypothetical protein
MDPSTLAPAAIAQVVAVWLIQKLKTAGWFPWLSANSATASRVVAIVFAGLAAGGITWQWAGSDVTIHGLNWATIQQHLWTWAAGISTNELTYMLVQIKAQATATGQTVGAPALPAPVGPGPDKPAAAVATTPFPPSNEGPKQAVMSARKTAVDATVGEKGEL